jgi:predicted negative regulator of RcsB-dependent stress response
MATLDLQEQEQVEALKAWWQKNGKGTLLVAILTIIAFSGWQVWHTYKATQAHAAALMFSRLNQLTASGDAKQIDDAAGALIAEHPASPYAPRAAMIAAQADIKANDITHARERLQWAVDNAQEDDLKNMARLNLASLLLDQQDYTGAMAQLTGEHTDAFIPLFADLKGDVFLAQDKTDEARAAWQLAYDKTDAGNPFRDALQIKLDMLGVTK